MLASLEVFRVPVSVRSIAISLKLRAAWILDCTDMDGDDLSKHVIRQFNSSTLADHACGVCCMSSIFLIMRVACGVGLTDLALLAVQVELVLADGHGPDGLDEGRTGVPRMHSDATVAKRPSRHRRPTVGADTRPPYIH